MNSRHPSCYRKVNSKIHLRQSTEGGASALTRITSGIDEGSYFELLKYQRPGGKELSPKTAVNSHGVFYRTLNQTFNINSIRSNQIDRLKRESAERMERFIRSSIAQ
ncbi:MAG TPA: hypothetical protein H9845_04715 [Candidatus Agathobaculum pullicola]|nr:hypothetical protein [Candidatus Agathobaculum pullicola]